MLHTKASPHPSQSESRFAKYFKCKFMKIRSFTHLSLHVLYRMCNSAFLSSVLVSFSRAQQHWKQTWHACEWWGKEVWAPSQDVLTRTGQPLPIGAEFYWWDSFCVSCQRELQGVVWFYRGRLRKENPAFRKTNASSVPSPGQHTSHVQRTSQATPYFSSSREVPQAGNVSGLWRATTRDCSQLGRSDWADRPSLTLAHCLVVYLIHYHKTQRQPPAHLAAF